MKPVCYIARTEDFQKWLTNYGKLKLIQVFPDGSVVTTFVDGYATEIKQVPLTSNGFWKVKLVNQYDPEMDIIDLHLI